MVGLGWREKLLWNLDTDFHVGDIVELLVEMKSQDFVVIHAGAVGKVINDDLFQDLFYEIEFENHTRWLIYKGNAEQKIKKVIQ